MPRLLLSTLAVTAALGTVVPAGAGETSLARSLVDEINAARAAHGLSQLALNTGLEAAADQHSEEMARDGYFAHESANGGSFSQRIREYYGVRGTHDWAAGENLLWASPGIGPKEAIELWLASPEHREIMLSSRWREVGVDAVHVRANGFYGGHWVTIVTADFGVRH
jgi:uncharacterized protein YkwD